MDADELREHERRTEALKNSKCWASLATASTGHAVGVLARALERDDEQNIQARLKEAQSELLRAYEMATQGADRARNRVGAAMEQDPMRYEFEDCVDDRCPTCKGKGTVNPLTAPDDFFCTGTTDCPTCDGSGEI